MKSLKKIALLTILISLCATTVFAKGKKDKKPVSENNVEITIPETDTENTK